jgi:hypothetical protein
MTTQQGGPGSGRRSEADRREPGQSRDAGRDPGRDSGRDSGRGPGGDITGDLQRWLIRSSARNMRRELTGQFLRTFNRGEQDNVWGVATTEPPEPSAEAPECAWCPICRAARRISESRRAESRGIGEQLAGAGDVVAAAVHEAVAAFESVLPLRPREHEQAGFPTDRYPAGRFPADKFPEAGTPPPGADHEPDDRG